MGLRRWGKLSAVWKPDWRSNTALTRRGSAAEFFIECAGLAKVQSVWPVISRVGEPTEARFFIDERVARHGITLTDHLLQLANVLPLKVDARWNLVQTSCGLGAGHAAGLVPDRPDQDTVDLHRHRHEPRRPSITCCRSSSCLADGMTVTCTRSGISSWPAACVAGELWGIRWWSLTRRSTFSCPSPTPLE
jgi:hypothetical protein